MLALIGAEQVITVDRDTYKTGDEVVYGLILVVFGGFYRVCTPA